MRTPIINASLLGLCIAYSAQAEDKKIGQPEALENNAIEEIHVTGLSRYSATKSDTPVMETSRSISVISKQAIIDKGAASLADATAYNAGVTANAYGFATRGDWIKVRGINASTYQDSLQSLFGSYNNSRLPIYGVEQIEILKGPSAVLYGSGNAGGLVNVITKKPQAESKGEIALEYGNFDRKQITTDWTGNFDESSEFLYRFVGLIRDSDTQVDHVKDQALYLAPSFTWKPTDTTNLTALLSYNKTKSDTASQFLPVYGTLKKAINGKRIDRNTYLGEPDFNKYDTESKSITLLGDHQFNDVFSLTGTARYSEGKVDYQQAWVSFLPDTNPIPGLPPSMPLIIEDRYIVINAPNGKSLYKDGLMPRTFYKADSESKQLAVDIRSLAEFDTGNVGHKVT